MKIIYRMGSLLDADEPIIVQGCNAQGVQASGLAKAIRDAYPQVFRAYRDVYEMQGNRLDLGQVISVDVGRYIVANAITQEFYGRDPDVLYASYAAIETAIQTLDRVADASCRCEFAGLCKTKVTRIAFPLIGAGLANGSWARISAIIEEHAVHFEPIVYLLDGVIPTT
jgi:O-acetyl-ADP-ribose deacetylase (regulator of RNase III)